MYILLDFDGVMVTTPTWKPVPQLDDGFMAFNQNCAKNLADILQHIDAEVVLTTTHRIHYHEGKWREVFKKRGILTSKVSKVNTASECSDFKPRHLEIIEWMQNNPNATFVILDDDRSLHQLPDAIKQFWIETQFHSGFNSKEKGHLLQLITDLSNSFHLALRT